MTRPEIYGIIFPKLRLPREDLLAKRISREPMRKIRFFQENMYISADFRKKEIEAFSKAEGVSMELLAADPTAFIRAIYVEIDRTEPLLAEMESFTKSVMNGVEPAVTGRQALEALRVAEKVLESLKRTGKAG